MSSTASSSASRRASYPAGHALRRAEAGLGRQPLDLEQHRPRALEQRGDRAPRRVMAFAIAEEERRRVLDRNQPLLRHAEHADLVDAAEAVLRRAQHAMVERPSPSK